MSTAIETSKRRASDRVAEAVLKAEILLLLWTVTPCVRLLGFFPTARLCKAVANRLDRSPLPGLNDGAPIDFCRLVETQSASPLALPTHCMAQSIALQFVLEQHGHPSEIKLGVQNLIGGLRAHAWVEASGEELATTPVGQQYVPFTSA